jgi:Holliday junction resolvase RusA-like endonuclease
MSAPRLVRSDKWANRPVVARYHAYKDQLNLALPSYELPPVLKIEFHIAMPKSWSAKKRAAMIGQYHQSKPDVDNLVKGFMDAFHTDDAHVAVLHAGKYWAETGRIVLLLK